jgi:hypothetical protein
MLLFYVCALELTCYIGIVLGSWGKVSSGSCCFTECGITDIRSHAYCAGCLEQKSTYSITSVVINFLVGLITNTHQTASILSGVFNRCRWGSNERRVWQAVRCPDKRSSDVLTSLATDNYCGASNVFPASELWFMCTFPFVCSMQSG